MGTTETRAEAGTDETRAGTNETRAGTGLGAPTTGTGTEASNPRPFIVWLKRPEMMSRWEFVSPILQFLRGGLCLADCWWWTSPWPPQLQTCACRMKSREQEVRNGPPSSALPSNGSRVPTYNLEINLSCGSAGAERPAVGTEASEGGWVASSCYSWAERQCLGLGFWR